MNPKILKKLKDAGFFKEKADELFGPTAPHLEDLIDECGEGFYGLRRSGKQWLAFHSTDKYVAGDTPLDAIANLWLKIFDR